MTAVRALAAVGLALVGPAGANDSTGFQGTTGIVLSKSNDIRVVSEDLRVGLDEISVAHVFRNEGTRPVETFVAFPLPDLDLSEGLTASNWGFPLADDDFLGFKLWIDDKPVTPDLERRAVLDGRDVTETVVAANGFLLAPWREGGHDEWARKMSPADLKRLRDAGLVRQGEDENNPAWTLRAAYHWRMTFPVGLDVRVRHVYRPFVGRAVMGEPGKIDGRKAYGRPLDPPPRGVEDRYCLEESTKRALVAAWSRAGAGSEPFSAAEIAYVLTTGANWRGPIGRFHLTIDKGAPDNLVSLCWDGLRKTGPTTFESTLADFTPTRELDLLLFIRSKKTGE